MTASNVIPSKNPADEGSLAGSLNTIFRKKHLKLHGQLPAIVVSYNRTKNIATVRPLIQQVTTAGTIVSRASIANVPVLALGGGGYTMTFPLAAGDLGWIEASDRDISLFMQSMKESPVNTFRIHNFSDGRFVPDAFKQYTFDATDDGSSMVIQNYAGTVKICLDPAQIRLIAPTVNIQAGALITMTAPAIQINQTGGGAGATFTGSPVVMPDAVINGIKQSTHVHGGVQTGSGNSSGPHN